HCVRPPDVSKWVADSGLACWFLGGYFVPGEREDYRQLGPEALADSRLPERQRAFLSSLTEDADGFPLYQGKPAGLGGVYRLTRQ
ncbi:MAG: hypothetical protein ACR2K5_12270, partial [Pseudolabrys sp.]